MKVHFLSLVFFGLLVFSIAETSAAGARAPIYFNIIHHQEAVGNPCESLAGFPDWETFKANLQSELALLDDRKVVSDQYFSDFIVSVAFYMADTGRDVNAMEIFDWFKESDQNLGYHFHPTTWDVPIRTDMIATLAFDEAVTQYAQWEAAYYDWEPCLAMGFSKICLQCGTLDTGQPGGVQLMEQYFGTAEKKTVIECGLMRYAPVGQMFKNTYILPRDQEICCSQGAPHSHTASDNGLRTMWTSDLTLDSSELFLYAYKMMGLYFIKHTSNATIEGRYSPPTLLAQRLEMLPPDVPHFFVIHLTVNTSMIDPLISILDYLQDEFIPANPNCRFVSGADIPDMVIENPRQFTMAELDEAATYFLQNYMARPPAFIKYNGHFMSNASLFKALQSTLQTYLSGAGRSGTKSNPWPDSIEAPDFVYPPLGMPTALSRDIRVIDAMPMSAFADAVMNLLPGDAVPYTVTITLPLPSDPLTVNAAEFLNGMCTLFLRLRNAAGPVEDLLELPIHLIPGYIVPISNLDREAERNAGFNFASLTPLEWFTDLQTWTLEPLQLKSSSVVEEGETEGAAEGTLEGEEEGTEEGVIEGILEGEEEGTEEGVVEGLFEGEGEGMAEGEGEGTSPEGEGAMQEGEGVMEGEAVDEFCTADQNADHQISLSELLRVIQFFNSNGYHCDATGEDGYAPGPGETACLPHDSDYNAQDWHINLSELLRLIQFFNSGGYHACPEEDTEDGFCVGVE